MSDITARVLARYILGSTGSRLVSVTLEPLLDGRLKYNLLGVIRNNLKDDPSQTVMSALEFLPTTASGRKFFSLIRIPLGRHLATKLNKALRRQGEIPDDYVDVELDVDTLEVSFDVWGRQVDSANPDESANYNPSVSRVIESLLGAPTFQNRTIERSLGGGTEYYLVYHYRYRVGLDLIDLLWSNLASELERSRP